MTQEELSPSFACSKVSVMEDEVLMCELYGPLRLKCYAGFPPLRHFHFPFNLSAPVKVSHLWVVFTPPPGSGPCSVEPRGYRMNDKLKGIWKETIVVYSRSQHLHGRSEGNH
jgi:hypothetical protein